MGATTIYVTHDQFEAMQMGDKIVVMNHGATKPFGVPQEICHWPATILMVEFIGSPAMNILPVRGAVAAGDAVILLDGHAVTIPESREEATGDLALGVRPKHMRLSTVGVHRGRISAAKCLGTMQILMVDTAQGEIKVRAPSEQTSRIDDVAGLEFDARTLTLFDVGTGRALRSAGNEGVLRHG